MARDYWEEPGYWDDECCMGCGERNYTHSHTAGICKGCLDGGSDEEFSLDSFWNSLDGQSVDGA